jgi:hypothetical protein
MREAGNVLTNIEYQFFIYNWKSRNKHLCTMANPGKTVTPQLAIDSKFVIAQLPILVQFKTKCTVGAVREIGN